MSPRPQAAQPAVPRPAPGIRTNGALARPSHPGGRLSKPSRGPAQSFRCEPCPSPKPRAGSRRWRQLPRGLPCRPLERSLQVWAPPCSEPRPESHPEMRRKAAQKQPGDLVPVGQSFLPSVSSSSSWSGRRVSTTMKTKCRLNTSRQWWLNPQWQNRCRQPGQASVCLTQGV